MSLKLVTIFALVAATYAVPVIYQHAPVLKTLVKHVELDAPAHYTFSYSVHDDTTGDIKDQEESRNGDDVQGHYSLIDADGYRRLVTYTANEKDGFQAVVSREPAKGAVKLVQPVHKIALAPIAHKAIVAAPIHHYVAPAIAHKVIAAPAKIISHGAATVSIDAHGVKTVY
ncbi:larval cuticle protein A2B-like [Culicoides brevitarsis]|uniref:larval cuticle protein A2B-like n=1 Tax=Culicoides brevitarsis TaxID=469753 RepID=UPI00307BBF0A